VAVRRNRFSFLGVILVISSVAASATAEETTVGGKVSRVTLYRGQALVTRTIPVEGKEGSLELVVTDLPAQVVPGSLFAEGTEAVEVRAVRYRTRAVGEEPREEVRQIDEAILEVNRQRAANARHRELLEKRSNYLDKLEGFVAPTATTELSKGVLNAESLEQITMFVFREREKIATEQLERAEDERQLNEQLQLLQRKRAEITSGASRTVREALLFLEKHGDGAASVRLNYLAEGCGWSPSYTFRAGPDGKQVQVEYNALIHQMTGEDWDGVTLTLSTASPALNAAVPGLAPFHIALVPERPRAPQPQQSNQPQQAPGQPAAQTELFSKYQAFKGKQQMAINRNRSTVNLSDNISSAWEANAAANEVQSLEIVGGRDLLRSLQAEEVSDEPSLSYQLDGSVSLASRDDQQMVRILQSTFESHFYHVATPVLASYVYREAEMRNNSEVDLLAGPITVYLGGRFVGRGEIPTVARGQGFVVGFGADPQLRARRELVSKEDDYQGGNRELRFKYRLLIENYKQEPVPVRVLDRLPHAEKTEVIRVTLGELSDPLSEDKLYLRTERPKGILRWDIEVPAEATGEKVRTITYEYTVEFDRSFELTAAGGNGQQRLQEEFEQLQRQRLTH